MFSLSNIKVIRNSRTILSVDQLNIPTDKLTVILGHNGSGKSTLVNLLSGLTQPDNGEIYLDGKPIKSFTTKTLAKSIAYLPQKLPNSAGLTVRELVRLGRFPWRGLLGRWNKNDENVIAQAINQAGINGFSDTLADELSGGERQRAWIAMLLAQQSPILILDEPTSALDIHHQFQLMTLLTKLNHDQQRGIIVILHDLNLTLRFASHVIALKQGTIAFNGSIKSLANEKRLSSLYQTPITLIPHPSPQKNSEINKVAVVCA
ncbi:ABC transporter ATP-binding protein [Vibrio salinus]|uniref:ABC transporter ATP-binding protein n=1 Tax=Vibrio salinus TaxID=2899784 RepID=UPI001E4F87EA|nr:ABC transporter ATP-binding protein [Vibrio salinus]MCE0496098.1 ABC transporter ATP-binding protein [Vibrio salinus]